MPLSKPEGMSSPQNHSECTTDATNMTRNYLAACSQENDNTGHYVKGLGSPKLFQGKTNLMVMGHWSLSLLIFN